MAYDRHFGSNVSTEHHVKVHDRQIDKDRERKNQTDRQTYADRQRQKETPPTVHHDGHFVRLGIHVIADHHVKVQNRQVDKKGEKQTDI